MIGLTRIVLLLGLVPALAIAETTEPPSPAAMIAARQAGFKAMGGAMKTLRDQLKSDAPDAAAMAAAARTIAVTARGQGALFASGTGPEAGVRTDALPAIWTDRARFDTLMAALVTESARLETVAGAGDAAATGAQVAVTGATCGACHKAFRADS